MVSTYRSRRIKKRCQEYREIYKKDLHDPENNNGVATPLKPDIVACEVKLALGSITLNKASGDNRIPVELLQILKMMMLKCSINQMIWETHQCPQDWKMTVLIQFQRKWKWKWSRSVVSDPLDCSLPGFSVHGIFQAIVLEWITISFSSSKERQCQRMLIQLHSKGIFGEV